MHSEHDLDLVTALAQGTAVDPAPARALMAGCDECARTYEAVATVAAAVASAPAPALSDLERRRLHDALWAEVGVGTAAVETPRRAASPWWYRAAPVAAALVVVVGVGAALSGGGDTAATLDTVAAGMPEGADEAAGGQESAADMLAAPEAAGDATATTAATYSRQVPMIVASSQLEEAVADFTRRVEAGQVPEPEETRPCVADEVDGEPVVAIEPAVLDGEAVSFVALGATADVTSVLVFRDGDCSLLFDPR